MASGMTTTGSLADSLPTILHQARLVREFEGVMPQLVDKVTLPEGTGNIWNEISLEQLTAQSITESTVLNNPQQLDDTLLSLTPTKVAIQTRITDTVAARISKNVYAKIGALAQNAIQRKKDEDGITALDSGSSASDPGAGATLTSAHIASAKIRISSNVTEPGPPPYRAVLHGYQIKDLYDELVAGVGTYATPEGPAARVFTSGFNLPIANCEVYEDGNIPIDTNHDAKGGVFCQQGMILVQGMAPRVVMVRKEEVGGGATDIFHYDEYIYGLRSGTRWVYVMESDATAPTS